ncbi:WhiB family transcriptional regulator [Georgenia sp. EYE_87]|nr:WhiB family transcriptional regulator [Georgenia sp. EYE_87]
MTHESEAVPADTVNLGRSPATGGGAAPLLRSVTVIARLSWAVDAACAKTPPDTLFVHGAAQRSARELCFTCPVRMACLVEALGSRIEFGIWGAMTERERRALLKQHPDVTDWAAWLTENGRELDTPPMRTARLRAARAVVAG